MFPRFAVALLTFAVATFAAPNSSAAEAPYFEDFQVAGPGNVPPNFVETPDSAWTLLPEPPGFYRGGVVASGSDVAAGSSINLTNVAGHDFTVRTTFTLRTAPSETFRLSDMGLVALADTPDVTAAGYRLRYYVSGLGDVYQKLFLERASGPARAAVSDQRLFPAPAAGDPLTMTLRAAYANGALVLTGTLTHASQTISVQLSDPAPLNGTNFGFRQRAVVSSPHVSSLTVDYDDFSVFFEPRPVKLGDIAARLNVGPGNDAAIAGFIVTGTERKRVLLRGTGSYPQPSLADPVVELHGPDGRLLDANDNWQDTQKSEIDATGLAPSTPESGALIAELEPGAYTAILRGKNQTAGGALVEVYDLATHAGSKLANISARGRVGAGDRAMIAGVIVTGTDKARVIVRALGPSLADAGIPGTLSDPTLELHDRNGSLVRSNDNWRETQEAEIMATGLAPAKDAEAAIVADLLPTGYTAVVRGKSDGIGIALVEVYHLN